MQRCKLLWSQMVVCLVYLLAAVKCWSFFAGKFNWKGTIKAVLRQSPEEGIAVKKLRKKVTPLWVHITEEVCGSGWLPFPAFGGLFGMRLVLYIQECLCISSDCNAIWACMIIFISFLYLFQLLQVLAAYYSFSGDGNFRSEEELFSLFNKKINGNPKFKVFKDKVRLVK